MEGQKKYPDFFIVGAPKSGTTALDHFLTQHPSVFMAKKEIHFFGDDLGIIQNELNEDNYLSHFNDATIEQLKGESSVWYLYSKTAAIEIKEANPTAKVIIMLRNPSEMIVSLHEQFLFNGDETEKDFSKAFNTDLARTEPNPTFSFKNRPTYIESVQYNEQVKRYINQFGEDHILIVLHDEFKNNFQETYFKILSFLNVDTKHTPKQELINARRKIKKVKLHQLSKNPPTLLKRIVRVILPSKKLRHSLMGNFDELNIERKESNIIPEDIKEKTIELIKDDIQQLSNLIKKDLTSWLN